MRRNSLVRCVTKPLLLVATWAVSVLGAPPELAETGAGSKHRHGEAASSGGSEERRTLSLHFVYDNYAHRETCTTDWGFGCVVDGLEKTILFDTGRKGELLLENFASMGIDPRSPALVVLSHHHRDHTGGLAAFLAQKNDVFVYVPASASKEFAEDVEAAGAELVPVTKAVELCENGFLTGQIPGSPDEQGLILNTGEGLVLITGCAHPGIVNMTRQVKEQFKQDVVLVLGGFHLGRLSESEAAVVAEDLRELGVSKIGPTHCTGKKAMAVFEQAFGEDYLRLGVGKTLELSAAPSAVERRP